ncbi:MAG TPA: 4Fe-4S dicluster domain-containing protein, partial [Holophagaceae bacterium]|nr:4Fe-4S dicluster domain-containing protein [Holophagaceae bacterium]
CPQDAIVKAGPSAGLGLNTPHIEPRNMPCFLCTDLPCITACPDGALVWPVRKEAGAQAESPARPGPEAVRMGTARVKESLCLTYAREVREALACQTCVDRCPYPGVAIRIGEPAEGQAIGHPIVDLETCTGCGLCVFGCPTPEPAIVVDPRR